LTEVESGRIRGIDYQGVLSFKGIPYGASTTGANRFRPAQPVEPWAGVRDTIVYGHQVPYEVGVSTTPGPMPQDAFVLYRKAHTASEDCLRLNVWTPSTTGKRPVLVYMHGGGFAVGSGNDLLAYDGENLARSGDAVVVTHNHRLNLFGFLDLTSFGGEWEDSVNLGMRDIETVLRWVQTNIGAFGGDPSNVTIFGQSGGGGKVQALLAMPATKGLFHRAVVQSGTLGGLFQGMSRERGEEQATEIVRTLGVTTDRLDRLREVPAEEVAKLAAAGGMIAYQPVVDGRYITSHLGAKESLRPDVPLLVGSILNEFVTPLDHPRQDDYDRQDLLADATQRYGDLGPRIVEAYRECYPDRTDLEVWGAMEAAGVRDASLGLVDAQAEAGGDGFHYLFSWATPVLEGRARTFHSAEIAFVFDNAGLCVNQTGGGPEALKLGAQVSGAWLALARNGHPNHAGLPDWPTGDHDHATMIFDSECVVVNDPERAGRDLIRQALAHV
jgi:para-nitrobenzyl esterase